MIIVRIWVPLISPPEVYHQYKMNFIQFDGNCNCLNFIISIYRTPRAKMCQDICQIFNNSATKCQIIITVFLLTISVPLSVRMLSCTYHFVHTFTSESIKKTIVYVILTFWRISQTQSSKQITNKNPC